MVVLTTQTPVTKEDEAVTQDVVSGKLSSYSLERKTGKALDGLPLEGLDYESILGQCSEMSVGYVQIPVGIVGPMLLDGKEFLIPMATAEGCLVASTNREAARLFTPPMEPPAS